MAASLDVETVTITMQHTTCRHTLDGAMLFVFETVDRYKLIDPRVSITPAWWYEGDESHRYYEVQVTGGVPPT